MNECSGAVHGSISVKTRRRLFDPAPMPMWIVILAVVGICVLVLPLVGMGNEVPWARIPAIMASPEAQDALWLSVRTCVIATVIDVFLGVPIALLLARDWNGVAAVRVLVLLPLSLPPVVAGLALLATFGRRGMIGASLHAAGISIAFSTAAVVMAQVYVSLPFLVTALESSIRTRSWKLEQTAAALGAGPWRVLRTITMPTVASALGRGTALAAARCLGEFGATITFAGSLQSVTRTMPLQVYLARETDSDTAMALGLVLVVVGAIVAGLTQWQPSQRSWRRNEPPLVEEGLTGQGNYELADTRGTPYERHVCEQSDPGKDLPEQSSITTELGTSAVTVWSPQAHDDSVSRVRGASAGHESIGSAAAAIHVDGQVSARSWDVRLDVEPGEVVAVMGPNGAGKSTLASVVTGLLALDRGRVCIGRQLVDAGDGRIVLPGRRGVGLLTQDALIFEHMSVLDNVAYGPRCHGLSRAQAQKVAYAQLAAVGCAHLAARRGGELSGGQAALVGLARAFAVEPAVLVLDEPTAALDIDAQIRVRDLLKFQLDRTNMTALIITHDVADTMTVAGRLVVLEHGRIIEDGAVSQLLENPKKAFTAQLAALVKFGVRTNSQGAESSS